MKILNWFKSIFRPINYEQDVYWYINNYKMLGSEWLCDALENKLHLKKDFSFLSPSANLGMYESDTYDVLKKDGYNPTFYLSDLCSGKLKNKAKEREHFFWISGEDINASEIKFSYINKEKTVPIKFDVILDCKGAIWHKLVSCKGDLKDVIDLLQNYYELLSTSDSLLLIDYDVPKLLRRINDVYIKIYYQFRNVRKRDLKMNYMSEYTTYYYLFHFTEKRITNKTFRPLKLQINNKNFKDKFDIAYCTKNDLKKYIEELRIISLKKCKCKFRIYNCKRYFYALLALSPIFLLFFFVYIIFLIHIFRCLMLWKISANMYIQWIRILVKD